MQLISKCPLAHRKSIQPVRFASPRAADLHSMQSCQGSKGLPAVSTQGECSSKHRFPGRPNKAERRSETITAVSISLSKSYLPHCVSPQHTGILASIYFLGRCKSVGKICPDSFGVLRKRALCKFRALLHETKSLYLPVLIKN